jgi:site-specific DNA-methyltransferase (adenine-specific)
MNSHYQRDNITLYHGDLREVLPTLPEASVDFVCTDPPYGLGFMGHDWDHGVPGVSYWEVIRRVCKPGALMLAFGGTRTYHRLTCAIEDARWEIRDCLMWLYGQGFPKAPDVGVLIDKAKGATREVVGTKLGQPGYSLADHGRTNEVYGDLHNPTAECAVTAPATDLAKRWTGWANSLKPAWEPIILAMKPLDGTLAHNAEQWGVAGVNVNGSRIGTDSTVRTRNPRSESDGGWVSVNRSPVGGSASGRWPANLLLDEEAAGRLDEQTGTLTSGLMKAGQQRNRSRGEGGGAPSGSGDFPDMASERGTYGDSGGASRFFYVAKATKKERNPAQGPKNDHPTVKPLKLMEYLLTLLSTPTGGLVLDPFAGSGSTLLAAKQLGRACIGVELDPHNCEIAAARLKSL